MVKQLLNIYDRTTSKEREQGHNWYPNARAFCDSLAFWSNRTLPRVVAITSALSPQLSWKHNLKAVEAFVKSESVPYVTGAFLAKAKMIDSGRLPGATAFPLKTCPKTNCFYHNILNPNDPRYVTIDRHASMAVNGPQQLTYREYEPIANA